MPEIKKICTDCKKEFASEEFIYLCPKCGDAKLGDETRLGVIRMEYDYKHVKKHFEPSYFKSCSVKSQGRYIHLLPLKSVESLPPLEVGPTPLEKVERVRKELGLNNLFIKNDTCLPTGSFKDRASSVVVAKAREMKKDVIATASTGNAATALAGMAASASMKAIIFVPESAPFAKLTQIAMFGAILIPVKGTYDDAFDLCLKAAKEFGWYNRNTGYNPYTVEGKKTAAFEIWEQLGFKAPDKIFIPTGDGVILAGTYKGFYDLKEMGLIEKIPQIIPVQAEGSAAIVNALENGSEMVKPLKSSNTIADSISVSNPACGKWSLEIVRETNGFGVKVSDKEILTAMKELATLSGIFAEPAAAAAYAGLKKVKDQLDKEENIVVMITGSGLKDIKSASQAITIPEAIEPTLEAVKKIV